MSLGSSAWAYRISCDLVCGNTFDFSLQRTSFEQKLVFHLCLKAKLAAIPP